MPPCKSGECSVRWDGNTKERLQGLPRVILANRLTFTGRPRPDPTPTGRIGLSPGPSP
jgi:hypothetical protein